jgi:hypothetical protein
LKTASWIVLALVGAVTPLASLASVGVAYFSENDIIGGAEGIELGELAAGREDVETALKARRGTAAAFGTGYSLLFLLLVVLPYRRGEVWAWWSILAGTLTVSGIILLRVPMLGTRLGLGAAIPALVGVGLGLLLDVKRLKTPR